MGSAVELRARDERRSGRYRSATHFAATIGQNRLHLSGVLNSASGEYAPAPRLHPLPSPPEYRVTLAYVRDSGRDARQPRHGESRGILVVVVVSSSTRRPAKDEWVQRRAVPMGTRERDRRGDGGLQGRCREGDRAARWWWWWWSSSPSPSLRGRGRFRIAKEQRQVASSYRVAAGAWVYLRKETKEKSDKRVLRVDTILLLVLVRRVCETNQLLRVKLSVDEKNGLTR